MIRSEKRLKKVLVKGLETPIDVVEDILEVDRYRYNCWGFTARSKNWTSRPFWMTPREIERLLEARTVQVSEGDRQKGDIVVYRGYDAAIDPVSDDSILHTAILIEGDKVIHKPGSWPLCIEGLEEVNKRHVYGRVAEIRRMR
jgi:hypothetical protein